MRFAWTKKKIERLTWRTLEGDDAAAIAAELGLRYPRTVRDMQVELGLRVPLAKHKWTKAEIRTLRARYANTTAGDLGKLLGVTVSAIYNMAWKLGLEKNKEFLSELGRAKLTVAGVPHRFGKGHAPANKGLRRPGWSPGRMAETQFRKGAANNKWKPVGTILPDHEGFLRIKVREAKPEDRYTGFGNRDVWPLLNRHIWEQHKGPIPPHHAVVFKDGDRSHCEIGNLECISRAELMRRNTIHNYPPELVNNIMLLGAIKRKVREHAEKHDDGSAQPSV